MSENVIQCPTCSKKYKLPDSPPATFQCRSCGTVMDLSAFQPAAPVAPAPPAMPSKRRAAASAPPAAGGSPHRHGPVGGRRHGRGGARAGRHAHGRGRAQADAYDDEEEGRPHYQGSHGPNTALIVGSLIAVVVAIVLLFLFLGSRKEGAKEDTSQATKPATPVATTPPPVQTPKPPPEKPKPKVPAPTPMNARPELAEGSMDALPPPEGKRNYSRSQGEIKTYPWPDYVTADDRNKIEEDIQNLFLGGRDMRDAEKDLVAMDAYPTEGSKFRAVGRLISEFKNVIDRHKDNWDDPMMMPDLMIIDQILRQIDGVMERDFGETEPAKRMIHTTPESQAKSIIKHWNWWYDLEKWRLRRQPWDISQDTTSAADTGEDEPFGDDGGGAAPAPGTPAPGGGNGK